MYRLPAFFCPFSPARPSPPSHLIRSLSVDHNTTLTRSHHHQTYPQPANTVYSLLSNHLRHLSRSRCQRPRFPALREWSPSTLRSSGPNTRPLDLSPIASTRSTALSPIPNPPFPAPATRRICDSTRVPRFSSLLVRPFFLPSRALHSRSVLSVDDVLLPRPRPIDRRHERTRLGRPSI